MEATGHSRQVVSNQSGVHKHLQTVVEKHLNKPYQKPIAEHTLKAFDSIRGELNARQKHFEPGLVIDSGCGTGDSSTWLAEKYPDRMVLAIDRSAQRLDKCDQLAYSNLLFVRADLVDFWRILLNEACPVFAHYILYPNPYPKAEHLQRRWHGHPVFSSLLALGGHLELRSNWLVYLQEFSQALQYAGHCAEPVKILSGKAITAFEKKYQNSGQMLYQLQHQFPNTLNQA